MLEQAERIAGTKVEQALYDAGYYCNQVIAMWIEKNINLLIPE